MSLSQGYLQSLQVHPTRRLDTSEQLRAVCEVMYERT
jgi:hypothetical protein